MRGPAFTMSDDNLITPDQCRAARALMGWSRADLAARSGVGASTLSDFEGGKRVPYARTLVDVRRALEAGGVTFIPGDEGSGPGIRLRASAPASER